MKGKKVLDVRHIVVYYTRQKETTEGRSMELDV